jgi:hypothetical protein
MRKIFITTFRHKYPTAQKRVEEKGKKCLSGDAEKIEERILKIMTIDFLTISYSISH